MSKRVVVSVINDLASDQRVHRTCTTLSELGFDVLLVGRETRKSTCLKPRGYETLRMKLLINKGPIFYAEYNIRLFFFLLFKKVDILHANDLDTLLANHLIQRLKKISLVYDSHEYFTEVPELVEGSFAKRIWLFIERSIFPKLKNVLTVNKSIAAIYEKLYGVDLKVVRNVPISGAFNSSIDVKSRVELGLPKGKRVILLQGAGINADRGAEEMIEAMRWIDAVFLIVGSGDVVLSLKERVRELGLSSKVIFTGRIPFQELICFTKAADVGVTLDKDTNLNYRYSLPNKLFDYFQAGLPVIASDLIEVRRVIDEYQSGIILSSHEPKTMAKEINNYLNNTSFFNQTKRNVQKAKEELVWENEKEILINCYETIQ